MSGHDISRSDRIANEPRALQAPQIVIACVAMLAGTDLLAQTNSLRDVRRPPGSNAAAAREPSAGGAARREAPGAATASSQSGGQPNVLIVDGDERRPFAQSDKSEPPVNPELRRVSLFAVDVPKPRKVGVHDLVTVIIREDKRFSSDAKLETDKDVKLDATLEQWFRLDLEDRLVPQNFERAGKPGAKFELKNQYDGGGKFNRQDSLVTRIQTRVIDVKPNGNLVLEARKAIDVEGESQAVTLTGECRTADLTAQNTVLSTQVADLAIKVNHGGASHDAARRGWIRKAWDFFRPI